MDNKDTSDADARGEIKLEIVCNLYKLLDYWENVYDTAKNKDEARSASVQIGRLDIVISAFGKVVV